MAEGVNVLDRQAAEHPPCSQVKAVTCTTTALVAVFILACTIFISAISTAGVDRTNLKAEMKELNRELVKGQIDRARIDEKFEAIKDSLSRIEAIMGTGLTLKHAALPQNNP